MSDKCPKCKADISQQHRLNRPMITVFQCGRSYWGERFSDEDCRDGDTKDCLRRQLAAANEIIAKLPIYADTKERFIPIRDDCWIIGNGGGVEQTRPRWLVVDERWTTHYANCDSVFYSTSEAAQATTAQAQRQGKT